MSSSEPLASSTAGNLEVARGHRARLTTGEGVEGGGRRRRHCAWRGGTGSSGGPVGARIALTLVASCVCSGTGGNDVCDTGANRQVRERVSVKWRWGRGANR